MEALCKADIIAKSEWRLLSSCSLLAILMKWTRMSTRCFGVFLARISWTTQKLTWKLYSWSRRMTLEYIFFNIFTLWWKIQMCLKWFDKIFEMKLTWLNRLVKATTFGATTSLFFLFQAQLDNSSGWMLKKTGKSNKVSWEANSSGATCRRSKIALL